MTRTRYIFLFLVNRICGALFRAETPLGRVLAFLSNDFVLARTHSVRLDTSVHLLRVLLADEFSLSVLFITKDKFVGWN